MIIETGFGIIKPRAAGIAQGLERLTVAQKAVGSRPIIRPISLREPQNYFEGDCFQNFVY